MKVARRLDKAGSLITAGMVALGIAILTICQVYSANIGWLTIQRQDIPVAQINALVTTQSEWIMPPFAEYSWFSYLLERGLKVTNIFRPWHWEGQPYPNPLLEAVRNPGTGVVPASIRKIGEIDYVVLPGNQYAFLRTTVRDIPCQAFANDGNIDVSCSSDKPGSLIVNENRWSGWWAWIDRHPVPLLDGKTLSVDAPAGTHTYSFRYWPWDVPLGLLISLLGVGMAFWLGLKRRPRVISIGDKQD